MFANLHYQLHYTFPPLQITPLIHSRKLPNGAIWLKFGESLSSYPCPLCSLRVSMPLNHTLFTLSCVNHCLPGRVTVDSLSWKRETENK